MWRADAAGTVAAGPTDRINMVPPWRLLMMLASWHHSDGEELLTSRYNDTPSTLNNAAGKLLLTVACERAYDNQGALGGAHIGSRLKVQAQDLALHLRSLLMSGEHTL